MNSQLDISGVDHPDCKEQMFASLEELENENKIFVRADHDLEPALLQFREERAEEIEWNYRQDGPDVWELVVRKTGSAEKNETDDFDVREMPPPERHGTILERFKNLEVGGSFTLVNDHDPKPLYYEIRSIHGDTFEWEYLKREQDEYRVKISKTDASREMPEEASTRVDVRVIPPAERHKSIFHRFDLLVPGDAMEIVADHDPAPLRHQFMQSFGKDGFEWEYTQNDPNEVRVLLRKSESGVQGETSTDDSETGPSPDVKTIDDPELDVRSYEPQKRHELVFEKYDSLGSGEAFILVNDHDPKPLYYQMQQEMEGDVIWGYQQKGDGEWKVLIGKK